MTTTFNMGLLYYTGFLAVFFAQYMSYWIDLIAGCTDIPFQIIPTIHLGMLLQDLRDGVHYPTLCVMSFLFVFTFCCCNTNTFDDTKLPPRTLRQAFFTYHFRGFYNCFFLRQRATTELEINIGAEEMLQGDCPYATVLPILSAFGSRCAGRTLAHLVAWSAWSAFFYPHVKKPRYQELVLNGLNYNSYYHDAENLEQHMKERIAKFHVVVIKNFQVLDPRLASVVRRVADLGVNPYRQALIILVINVDKTSNDETLQELHASDIMETFFIDLWSHLMDEEPLKDIIRMMGKHAVFIQHEPTLRMTEAMTRLRNQNFACDEEIHGVGIAH